MAKKKRASKTSKRGKVKTARAVQKPIWKKLTWGMLFAKALFIAAFVYGIFHLLFIDISEGLSIITGVFIILVIVLIVHKLIKNAK